MKISVVLCAAFFAGGLALPSGAATIGFDDVLGGNPNGSYVEDGYSFTPNSGTNGQCPVSADAPCVKELKQGVITTMERVGGGLFDLLGFDFLLVGNGNNNGSIIVTGFLDPAKVFEIKFGDSLGVFANYTLATVAGGLVGDVDFNEGYRVVFNSTFFAGLTKAEFTTVSDASGDAQARIDNVVTPAEVPLPAAGWLLIAGLGGLVSMRRKAKAA